MGILQDRFGELEAMGYCPVCLTDIDSGSHDSCRIFSGIDPGEPRNTISIDLLNRFHGDWHQLAITMIYSVLVPWDLEEKDFTTWFANVEDAAIEIENGNTSPSRIVKFIDTNRQHLYSLRRLANSWRYSFDEYLADWDPHSALTSVDFLFEKKQTGKTEGSLIQAELPWTEILSALFRTLFDKEPSLEADHPKSWRRMQKTSRCLLYDEKEDIVVSTRCINGKPLISSCFTLRGEWLGWIIRESEFMRRPLTSDTVLPGFVTSGHILTNWDKLIARHTEEDMMRQVIQAHGMRVIGDPNIRRTDIRAMRSHAEILDSKHTPIWDSLSPIAETRAGADICFSDHSAATSSETLESEAAAFIAKYTPFKKPKSRVQARAIGWIIANGNAAIEIVMPTGSGKSLIPLCAAMKGYLDEGSENSPLTVVVCPMIALLDDQVQLARRSTSIEKFQKDGRRICALHSQKDADSRADTYKSIARGECSLLFLTAEQLLTETVIQQLSKRRINYTFIDEAHGVIEFEEYRPAYNRLWYPIERLKNSSPEMGVVAQTATLPPDWSRSLWSSLLHSKKKCSIKAFRSTAIRRNLVFEDPVVFEQGKGEERNRKSIDTAIDSALEGKRTVIYSVFKTANNYFDTMYRDLRTRLPKKVVGCYSGDGSKIGTSEIQREDFVKRFSRGDIDVVLATMAFGLGIDRKDVETVVLNGMPCNLNLLYQQAGRAARDSNLTGRIFLFSQPEEDFSHQRILSSQTRLHATTTTRYLQRMLFSKASRDLGKGIYLLDLTSQDKGDDYETDVNSAIKHRLNALRILSNVGAIDHIATLPSSFSVRSDLIRDLLRSSSERFLAEASYSDLERDLIETSTAEYLTYTSIGKDETISHIYEIARELSEAMTASGTKMHKNQTHALVAWTWSGSKRDLEQALASKRIQDDLAQYSREEELASRFLYTKNPDERLTLLSNYYEFCGTHCKGCRGCE